MKISIANHEFTELWDGVFYKALSDYPHVSDNEMKDIIDFVNYEKANGRQCEIEADREDILKYVLDEMRNPDKYKKCAQTEDNTGVYGLCGSRRMHDGSGVPYRSA